MATRRINHHGSDDSLDNVVEQHANKRLKKIQEEQAKAYERGRQQGFDWFKDHAIDAINEALLNSSNSKNNSLDILD